MGSFPQCIRGWAERGAETAWYQPREREEVEDGEFSNREEEEREAGDDASRDESWGCSHAESAGTGGCEVFEFKHTGLANWTLIFGCSLFTGGVLGVKWVYDDDIGIRFGC